MLYVIIFVAAVFVILWAVSLYLVKTGRLSAFEWHVNSLGLPQGSVRAVIALLLLFSLTSCLLTGTKIPDLPDWLVGILGAVVGFYFGAGKVSKASSPPSQPPRQDEGKTPPSQ